MKASHHLRSREIVGFARRFARGPLGPRGGLHLFDCARQMLIEVIDHKSQEIAHR